MALLSRTSYLIIAIVALLTVVATSFGVWHASRQTLPGTPRVKPVRPRPPGPSSPTQFSSPAEAKGILMKMLKAAQLQRPRDIQFLISRFGDFRPLPAPPENRDKTGKKGEKKDTKGKTEGDPSNVAEELNQPPTRWVSVSEVAQDLLASIDPTSVAPVLDKLRRVGGEHSSDHATWSQHELVLLKSCFQTLGKIQLHRIRAAKMKLEEPAIALLGRSVREAATEMDSKQLIGSREEHTQILGMVWITDRRVTVPAYRPTEAHPPHFDVTPANLGIVIEGIQKMLEGLPIPVKESQSVSEDANDEE